MSLMTYCETNTKIGINMLKGIMWIGINAENYEASVARKWSSSIVEYMWPSPHIQSRILLKIIDTHWNATQLRWIHENKYENVYSNSALDILSLRVAFMSILPMPCSILEALMRLKTNDCLGFRPVLAHPMSIIEFSGIFEWDCGTAVFIYRERKNL